MNRWQQVFSRKAGPFMRWVLGTFLLLYSAFMIIPLRGAIEDGRMVGVIACSLMMLMCVAGFLATWGVPYVGRIVTGLIALAYAYYVLDECILNFDGDWGFGETGASPKNAILGFIVFGLPCALYTIFGGFGLSEPEGPDDEGPDGED